MAWNSLMSSGLPVSSPLSLMREWHVAMASISGESSGSCVGSATISWNVLFFVSETPDKSRLPSVSVPVW